MWENLKQAVKKMVDKNKELEAQCRTQRDMHIDELAMMVASLIQSDISESLRIFDENYLICFTSGSVQVDNTFDDVLFDYHMGMIEDKIRRSVPDWISIIEVLHCDLVPNLTLTVDYMIDEDRVCAE